MKKIALVFDSSQQQICEEMIINDIFTFDISKQKNIDSLKLNCFAGVIFGDAATLQFEEIYDNEEFYIPLLAVSYKATKKIHSMIKFFPAKYNSITLVHELIDTLDLYRNKTYFIRDIDSHDANLNKFTKHKIEERALNAFDFKNVPENSTVILHGLTKNFFDEIEVRFKDDLKKMHIVADFNHSFSDNVLLKHDVSQICGLNQSVGLQFFVSFLKSSFEILRKFNKYRIEDEDFITWMQENCKFFKTELGTFTIENNTTMHMPFMFRTRKKGLASQWEYFNSLACGGTQKTLEEITDNINRFYKVVNTDNLTMLRNFNIICDTFDIVHHAWIGDFFPTNGFYDLKETILNIPKEHKHKKIDIIEINNQPYQIYNNDTFHPLRDHGYECDKCLDLEHRLTGHQNNTIIYIFYFLDKDLIRLAFCAEVKYKLSITNLNLLKSTLQTVFHVLSINRQMSEIQKAHCQSAIGQIMARNGSHNIGSHVLAALSHNVGTMPDDRILYQYIQHRMDYIATVTTERPNWTKPTKFVGDIMKEFFSQHHLLEYIAKSEGLSAYQFQHHNHDLALIPNFHKDQKGKIKIFIRKIFPHCPKCLTDNDCSCFSKFDEHNAVHVLRTEINEHNFIDYVSDSKIDLGHDVDIAIPGGVVGKHAFYTILENIIRNAAKHGWSKNKNHMEDNLEIYIDFCENFEDARIDFTIWDNMSSIFSHPKLAEHEYISQTIVLNLQPIIERKSFDNNEISKLVDLNNKLIGFLKNSINGEVAFDTIKPCVYESLKDCEKINRADLREIYDRFVIKPLEQILSNGNMSKDKINHVENSISKLNAILDKIKPSESFNVEYIKNKIESLKLFQKCEFSKKLNFDYLLSIEILQYLITNNFVEEKRLNQVFKAIADIPEISNVFENIDLESSLEIKFNELKKIFGKHKIKIENYTNDIRQINHSIVKILDTLIELDHKEKSIFKKIDLLLAKYANLNENYAENITLLEQKQYKSTFKKHFSDIVPTNKSIADIKDSIKKEVEKIAVAQNKNNSEQELNAYNSLEEEIFNLIEQEEILAQQEKLVANDVEKVDFVFFTHSLSNDEKEAIKILKEKDNNVRLPLHWQQQLLLDKSFISKSGELRKENWGLYEMKISAGFLSRLSIARIGGLSFDDEDSTKSTLRPNEAIITPVAMPGICRKSSDNHAIQCQNDLTCDCQKRFHLGYQFSIPKSKEILIILDTSNAIDKNILSHLAHNERTLHNELKKEGIYFRAKEDIDTDFSYEYVVVPKITESYEIYCPYRLLERGSRFDFLHDELGENTPNDLADLIKKIKLTVYEAWYESLKAIRTDIVEFPEQLSVLVQIQEGKNDESDDKTSKSLSKKSGQGLVTNKDILKFLMKEHLSSVLTGFNDHLTKLEAEQSTDYDNCSIIDEVSMDVKNIIENKNTNFHESFFEIEKGEQIFTKEVYGKISTASTKDFDVELAIIYIINELFKENILSGTVININEITRVQKLSFTKRDNLMTDIKKQNAQQLSNKLKIHLVDYFNQAFNAIEILLRKYEENITTLPRGYSDQSGVSTDQKEKHTAYGAYLHKEPQAGTHIKYQRHDQTDAYYYSEALSGTQSYLNTLNNLWDKNVDELFYNAFSTKLIENALMRILIIDERMSNFLVERKHLINRFCKMNIFAMDLEGKCGMDENERSNFRDNPHSLEKLLPTSDNYIKWLSDESINKNYNFKQWLIDNKITFDEANFVVPIKFDIVVIHQGIIDKWLNDKSQKNVQNFIDKLQSHIPKVLITTGRGSPENIPTTTKMIPFSSIENSMFKQYPEKLILVDTIMNALPKGVYTHE